ncbi:hypothetical protein GCM10010350_18670 [Streptomyces galilaeus]|nr:hypothetical protein GCM10010350_18670 [Streptomyces galilaeus]
MPWNRRVVELFTLKAIYGRPPVSGAFRVTPKGVLTTPAGAGLAFPPQVGAGCVSGREGLTRDPGPGTSEDPGSIGFAVPNMRLRRVARLNGKKNTGVRT